MRKVLLAALLAGLLQAGLLQAATAQASPTSYQGPILEDPGRRTLEVAPLWRDRLDQPTAVVSGGTVAYLSGGRLVAADLATGARRWEYGAGLTGPLAFARGLVLVAEAGGVVALDAQGGAVAWSSAELADRVRHLVVAGDDLLVASGGDGGAAVLDAAAGTLRTRLALPGVGTPVHFGDGLLLWSATYGEPNSLHFHAFDARTGQQLWQSQQPVALLALRAGRAYLLELGSARAEAAPGSLSIAVADARTGEELERWEYRLQDAGVEWRPYSGASVILGDSNLFVSTVGGEKVYAFPLGGAVTPMASYGVPGGGRFRAGPHLGLLFFETADNALSAARVNTELVGVGATIDYLPRGTPISRLDLVGARAFVGRTDGMFVAVDLGSARRRYLLRTGGGGFGATLDAGGHVVVQGSAEIFVLRDVE